MNEIKLQSTKVQVIEPIFSTNLLLNIELIDKVNEEPIDPEDMEDERDYHEVGKIKLLNNQLNSILY